MRKVVSALLIGIVGCEYGPEHLAYLYSERDRLQSVIERIEQKYGVEPRDPRSIRDAQFRADLAEAQRKLREANSRIDSFSDLAEGQEDLTAKLIELEDAWFRSLSSDQQLLWRMHRDFLRAGAKPEIRQTIQSTFGAPHPEQR